MKAVLVRITHVVTALVGALTGGWIGLTVTVAILTAKRSDDIGTPLLTGLVGAVGEA